MFFAFARTELAGAFAVKIQYGLNVEGCFDNLECGEGGEKYGMSFYRTERRQELGSMDEWRRISTRIKTKEKYNQELTRSNSGPAENSTILY